MESPQPIIYKEEIREIPDRAAAALSIRGIARIRELLSHIPCRRWPSEAEALADQLIERLHQITLTGDLGPSTFVLGRAGFDASVRLFEGMSEPAHMAWRGVEAGMTASGIGALNVFEQCVYLTWYIDPRSKSKKAERIVKDANWEDFRKLRLAFEAGELTKKTPVPTDSLGPLWPKGAHDWSKYTGRDVDAENAEQERMEEKELQQANQILDSLVPRSDELPPDLRDAFDRTAQARGEGWRHAFLDAAGGDVAKWPAALRKPKSAFVEQLFALCLVHGGAHLFIPPGDRLGALLLVPPDVMNAERAGMLEWDSALDSFDPEEAEDAAPAPCSKRDILVFARVNASPNAFFVVTKGPAAGRVFYFDHETGIDFDDPIADSLVGWIDALVDPERDWEWMDDEEG